jgi:hypothetical protein
MVDASSFISGQRFHDLSLTQLHFCWPFLLMAERLLLWFRFVLSGSFLCSARCICVLTLAC